MIITLFVQSTNFNTIKFTTNSNFNILLSRVELAMIDAGDRVVNGVVEDETNTVCATTAIKPSM
jgi:hypothetical protein